MATTNQTLRPEMTKTEFEEAVNNLFEIIKGSGLTSSVEKIREDMLKRFATLHNVSEEEAQKILDATEAPPPPVVTEEEVAATAEERKDKTAKAARRLRSSASSSSAGRYFWEKPADMAFTDMWFTLRTEGGLPANLLVTGPSGCGKTEGLVHAAERRGIPAYVIPCPSITSDDKWVGHKEVDNEGTHYVLSEHLRWLSGTDCEPGLVIYDELTRLHPTRLNILFPILDGRQNIWVPELGMTLAVHPNTVLAATANIGVGFSGTHKMDDALAGRFGYRIERDFPPVAEEIKVLEKRCGISAKEAKLLVEIADSTRIKARSSDLSMPVSTRSLIDAGMLLAAGMTVSESAEYTFVKMYSEDGGGQSERIMVRQIIAGKAGR